MARKRTGWVNAVTGRPVVGPKFDVEEKRPSKPKGSPLDAARINMVWFARALEGGVEMEDAIAEVYPTREALARDIRIILANAKASK